MSAPTPPPPGESAAFYRRAAAAYRAGYAAARTREPRRNPYNGNATTAVERVLSQMWARGFSRGNPIPTGGVARS